MAVPIDLELNGFIYCSIIIFFLFHRCLVTDRNRWKKALNSSASLSTTRFSCCPSSEPLSPSEGSPWETEATSPHWSWRCYRVNLSMPLTFSNTCCPTSSTRTWRARTIPNYCSEGRVPHTSPQSGAGVKRALYVNVIVRALVLNFGIISICLILFIAGEQMTSANCLWYMDLTVQRMGIIALGDIKTHTFSPKHETRWHAHH